MDKAKQSVKEFISRNGQHDTTVHKTEAAPVQHETVKPTQHENVTQAIDREVHRDHYHQTVQPIKDKEILPEKHTNNFGTVEHRVFDERDHDSTKAKLAQEDAKFKDERVVNSTQHSQTQAPVVGGEHVHHHIHEKVQPVIHKETVQPHVVHSTKPIHEVHHHAAEHHSTSALPTINMSDYQKSGGVLGGRGEHSAHFQGEPKDIVSSTHGGVDSRDESKAGFGLGSTTQTRHKSGGDSELNHHLAPNAQNLSSGGDGFAEENASTKEPSLLERLNPLSEHNSGTR